MKETKHNTKQNAKKTEIDYSDNVVQNKDVRRVEVSAILIYAIIAIYTLANVIYFAIAMDYYQVIVSALVGISIAFVISGIMQTMIKTAYTAINNQNEINKLKEKLMTSSVIQEKNICPFCKNNIPINYDICPICGYDKKHPEESFHNLKKN